MIVAVAVAVAVATSTDASAGPTATCDFNARKARLDITLASDYHSLYTEGLYIELDTNSMCNRATVSNTDTIVVTADDSSETYLCICVIDQRLAPGATNEGPDSEIEVRVHFGDAHQDVLNWLGTVHNDHIAVDGANLNLNADEADPDTDVFVTGLDDCILGRCDRLAVGTSFGADMVEQRPNPDHGAARVVIYTSQGDDMVRASSSPTAPTFVEGGGGSDVLITDRDASMWGEGGADLLIGSPSADAELHGGERRDRIFGRGGGDVLTGDYGQDIVVGGRGSDRLEGRSGRDRMWGGPGPDELLGGGGRDACAPEVGWTLREQECEQRLRGHPPDI